MSDESVMVLRCEPSEVLNVLHINSEGEPLFRVLVSYVPIARALAAERELAALQERTRWIPVGERLPEMEDGELASDRVEVAYQLGGKNPVFMRGHYQYWKNYGWVIKFENGAPLTLDSYGYVAVYWREYLPLPEPPEAENE